MQENQPLRILVVVAHPHDFTHCSATCGIHVARGDSVTVVAVTDGAKTHNERLHDELLKPEDERDARIISQTAEEYAAMKAEELRGACAVFGISDVRILPYKQPFRLDSTLEVVETLRDIICEVRPHVLITQRGYLSGRHRMASLVRDDHDEVFIAISEAASLAATPDYATPRTPHTIAATYYIGVYFGGDEIDFYVDISDWSDGRAKAESLFKSQGHTETFARRRVEIHAGHTGWYAGTAYAEGFVRAEPEVLPRIIVSERALAQASEPHMNHMRRLSGETGATQRGERCP